MDDFREHKKHRAKESGPKAKKKENARRKKSGDASRESNPKVS